MRIPSWRAGHLAFLCTLVVAAAVCVTPRAADAAATRIVLGTATEGGGFQLFGQHLAEAINRTDPSLRIDAIAIGENPPEDVNVLIEVSMGGQPIKYEMDKDAGTLVVDRFLYTPMAYPGNYGFVPHTLSEDGDPIDVLVCNTRELVPGCLINVRPIGVLIMEDNAGQDEKVIAVPSHALTKRYDDVKTAGDLPEITLHQIEHFFEHYKDLEPGKWVKIGDWHGADVAKRLIQEAIDRAR